ncbi:MAG: magnesium transporter [Chlamydiae bacterium]|jgi:magnesium transporter|nr:magnesium transporter [Chlamydiota bacterium]
MKKDDLDRCVRERVKKVESLLTIHQTVDEAIRHIRKLHILEKNIYYFYVVDDGLRLLGFVSARDLLISSPDTPIASLLNTKIKTLQSDHTMKEAILLMQKFHLLALPVLEEGRFIGVINMQDYFEESIEFDTAKKRDQVFQTLGFILEEDEKQPTLKKYVTRAPWMFCNMIGGILCAIISNFYQEILLKAIVLAMFIPLVLALSESISMQSMTQSMHEMSRYANFWKKIGAYLWRELRLFILIALSCGLIVGSLAILWGDGVAPSVVIGVGITISVIVSAIIGVLIPVILHAIKLDPKIASGPIVLMLADTITTSIYLSLACSWLL